MNARVLIVGALGFVGAIGVGCASRCPPVEPPITIVDVDAGEAPFDEPFDSANGYSNPRCASACANVLRRCGNAQTRPGEDSCYVVCVRGESTGVIDFNTLCLLRARTRAEVQACKSYQCK